jgi:CheY-like chemotaxis protein
LKILIVDDNEKIRYFIKRMLSNDDYVLLEAENGEAAVTSLLQHDPDVILMDIKMGDMDGIEATKLIKDKSEKIRVIIVTDYDEQSLRKRAKEAGAENYILKENLLDLREMLKN